MTFRPVASDEELADGFPLLVHVDGVPVCLVRSEGEVDGCEIECWLHGSRFDLRTGRPLSLPATEPVPVHPVKLEDGKVLVDVEETLA